MQVFVFRIFQGGRSTLIKRMQNKACISGMSDVHLMAHILYFILFYLVFVVPTIDGFGYRVSIPLAMQFRSCDDLSGRLALSSALYFLPCVQLRVTNGITETSQMSYHMV